jgi:cyanophycinase-like exopeptidase
MAPAGKSGESRPSPSLALLGSGEFEPWTEAVDRWLLDRATGDGTVLILPAASAPEGDSVFDRWADMGLAHYASLGIPAEVLQLKTRSDASRPEFAERLSSASMAYLSGGNPAYLAAILSGTPFWSELLAALGRGMAYTGCSAGIACLGELAVDSSVRDFTSEELWKPGLRLFPRTQFGPHWDALDTYVPGLRQRFIAAVPEEWRLLGIDERTAVTGDGSDWLVLGSGGAHLRTGGEWRSFPAGERFTEPFEISLTPTEPWQR